ncbi:hypothetical protein EU92_0477 [Prochlorococcus marinus str. MIT 9107]|uniref:Glycosyltransferase 2-like domain-containing protein n=3 Tax=Prochlorococcaceae TaxID=2881426 RepID=A0A0A1ZU45_PROMR|nr:hypothetical protein EU92_0477 [Prochlorococcus marinus str. MIT 9107]KGF93082.1 hypothetical protein EU93_0257 [Prochlorococcus marinus str. MIT 9116]KGF93959.1 hypothetical protein EU94_0865 [Prochlorococcus marinus str. MIT 9123]
MHESLVEHHSQILKNFEGVLIKQKGKLKTAREHIDSLLNYSNSKYIMFCHDDDLFSPQMAIYILNLLKKFQPNSLCSKVKYINQKGLLLPNRQDKSINKINFINENQVLRGYFLPFSRPIVYPTMVYERIRLIKYFKNNSYLGPHEDVRIIYEFARKGLMVMNLKSDLYFYRTHPGQDSSVRNTIPRLRLMVWLKNLNTNIFLKFALFNFSKIQYIVFYKKNSFAFKFIDRIFNSIRYNLIKFRSGEKLF